MTNRKIMKGIKDIMQTANVDKAARSIARMIRPKKPTEWGIRGERDERNTDRLLQLVLEKNANCIDVGAHKGVFLDRFLSLAPEGRHTAFEPIPHLAQALEEKYTDVTVINCGLSSKAGQATFYHVRELEAWSGLQKQPYPKDVIPEEIPIELKTLDNLFNNGPAIRFIKIDVEGAELEVLKGAEELLKRDQPFVLFEHARIHNENYETTPELLYDFLVETCGMKIWDLGLTEPFSAVGLRATYDSSHASNYDRNAQTNFVAAPGDWDLNQ